MSKLITIKNDDLIVEISTYGAEMQSVKCNGIDYLWNGDPAFWTGRAPLLFPICGGLKDDKYVYNGKEYGLQKHGYARFCEFKAEAVTECSAVFLLKSDEESRKVYPFDYELRVKYELINKSIVVSYSVKNMSDGEMFFSIGSHEAYACPEGIEEYSLHFEKKEHLTSNELDGNYLTNKQIVLGDDIDCLPLDYKYFAIDALTFLNLNSRTIVLKHNKSNRSVRVDFDGFDYTFVWTKPDAGYICIEPWCGIPDFKGTSYDIDKKLGINRIEKDGVFNRTHTITIEG